MSRNGYTNDDTWFVASACDNTEAFQHTINEMGLRAKNGDVDGAAEELRRLTVDDGAADHIPSDCNFDLVDWVDIVTTWARDAA